MRGFWRYLAFVVAGLVALSAVAANFAAQPVPQRGGDEQAEPGPAPATPPEGAPTKESGQNEASPDQAAPTKRPVAKPAAPSLTPPKPRGPLQLPTRIDPKTGRKVIVINNAVLERIYGVQDQEEPAGRAAETVDQGEPPAQGVAEVPAAPPAAGPLPSAAAPGDKRAELERLKNRALSLRNPFVPRVPQTEEEARDEQGLDNAQRVAATEKRIAELEAELAKQQGTELSEPGTP